MLVVNSSQDSYQLKIDFKKYQQLPVQKEVHDTANINKKYTLYFNA